MGGLGSCCREEEGGWENRHADEWRMNGNLQLLGAGGLTLRSPRDLGWERLPGPNVDDLAEMPNSGKMEPEETTSSS